MPETQTDDEATQAMLIAQMNSAAAYQELSDLKARDHTEKEELAAQLKAAESGYYFAATQASVMSRDWMADYSRGVSKETLERAEMALTGKRWGVELLRVEVEALRSKISDNTTRELTESSLEVARETAKAARWTAWATIVLAVATVVLIAATLVAASIASG